MTSILTKFWNGLLGLEAPPSPPDLHIVIEPSRRDLWRFRLVNHETGKTVMVSAGRGKKTFEEALQAAQAVASADIIGDWTFWQANVPFRQTENQHENQPKSVNIDNLDSFGVPGPPITTQDLRSIPTPDPPITETEPTITETEPVTTVTTVGFGTYDPTEAHRIKIWKKALQRKEFQAAFPKEKPYHYKQESPIDNGETKMKI